MNISVCHFEIHVYSHWSKMYTTNRVHKILLWCDWYSACKIVWNIYISIAKSILLKERVRQFSVEVKRTELKCVV